MQKAHKGLIYDTNKSLKFNVKYKEIKHFKSVRNKTL